MSNCETSEDGYAYENFDVSNYFSQIWFVTIWMEDVNISDNTSTLIPAIIFSNNTKIITAKFYGQNISQGIYAIAAFGLSK